MGCSVLKELIRFGKVLGNFLQFIYEMYELS